MNVLYVNTLEYQTGENRVRTAQVSITEHQGLWRTIWSETKEDGRIMEHAWYEGAHWPELLAAFREGLREKQNEGYAPLLPVEQDGAAKRSRAAAALQCYAESHIHPDAFRKLRQWRWETSIKEGKASFIIASNRLLHLLSAYLPQQPDELKQIPGFGEQKIQQYGEAILACTREIERETSFPLDWVEQAVTPQELDQWIAGQKQAKEKQEQSRIRLKQQLLDALQKGHTLDELKRELSLRKTDVLILIEQAEREGYDVDSWLEQQLISVEADEQERVFQLFAASGDRYLKPVLHQWYGEEDLKDQDITRLYELLRMLRIRFRRNQDAARAASTESAVNSGAEVADAEEQTA